MNRTIIMTAIAAVVCSAPLWAGDTLPLKSVNKANEVIDAALAAHGGTETLSGMKTLVQESEFITWANGQSRNPGPPWDKSKSVNFNAIDLENDIIVTRNAGSGGGFDFSGGTIINGEDSWQLNFRAGTAAPLSEPDFNTTAGPFVRVTPALLMRQLQERRQTSHWLGEVEYDGRPHDVITLVMEVGPGLSLYFDQESHMLTRMERVLPPFGQVEYRFLDYETIDGIAFNRSFRLLINGDDNLDVTNNMIAVNAPLSEYTKVDKQLAQIPARGRDEFNLQEIDEGVFLVGGNGAYGLLVEMSDHIVAIGGTQGAAQRMKEVRKHIEDKPVKYGVLTHHHSDHVPGVADYAQESAAIVTFRENESVVRNAGGQDEIDLQFVEDQFTLSDGSRTIELYNIGPTPHAENMLVAYLPKEKILFEADHFPQPRTGPIPPAVPATEAFAAAVDRLNLDIEKIVGAHSPRIGSTADLQAALRAKPARAMGAQ